MPSTLTKRPRLLTATIVGTPALGFGAVSVAADIADTPHVLVRFCDRDVSTSSGAATLHSRITAAARGVCKPYCTDPLFLNYYSWHKTYIHDAIARAVSKVGVRRLATIYKGKNQERR